MAEILHLLTRYDRHCLDTLLDTSTEARLRAEGHVFVLTDMTEYSREEFGLPPQPDVIHPRDELEEDRKFWQEALAEEPPVAPPYQPEEPVNP